MRRHLAGVAVLGLLVTACQAVSPSTGQTAMPTSTPTALTSDQANRTTTPASPPPGSSATAGDTGSSAAVQKYLATARQVFPAKDDAARVQVAQSVCASLRATTSRQDVVGDLAGELSSQATAQRLVDEAMAAFCPDAAPS